MRHDAGANALSKPRVGHADRRSLQYVRVLMEHLLDLARVDVGAPANDQLLLSVDDLEIAALVKNSDVAGREPTVRAEAARIGFRVIIVADRHRRPVGQDLAWRAGS